MKIEIKKRPRKFKINIGRKKIELSDTAKIYLKKNEQVTFSYLNSEYDVAKKDWGLLCNTLYKWKIKKFWI